MNTSWFNIHWLFNNSLNSVKLPLFYFSFDPNFMLFNRKFLGLSFRNIIQRCSSCFCINTNYFNAFNDVQWNVHSTWLCSKMDRMDSVHITLQVWSSLPPFEWVSWRKIPNNIWCVWLQKRPADKFEFLAKHFCFDWVDWLFLWFGIHFT